MGSPDRIFSASLTELESHHLPAAVAQAIHARQPPSAAAKESARARPPESGCSHGTSLSTRSVYAKFMIRGRCSMFAEILNF